MPSKQAGVLFLVSPVNFPRNFFSHICVLVTKASSASMWNVIQWGTGIGEEEEEGALKESALKVPDATVGGLSALLLLILASHQQSDKQKLNPYRETISAFQNSQGRNKKLRCYT